MRPGRAATTGLPHALPAERKRRARVPPVGPAFAPDHHQFDLVHPHCHWIGGSQAGHGFNELGGEPMVRSNGFVAESRSRTSEIARSICAPATVDVLPIPMMVKCRPTSGTGSSASCVKVF